MQLLRLRIAASVPEVIRCRISYAFQVFCAVYGYVPTDAAAGVATLCYGVEPASGFDVPVHAGYTLRSTTQPLTRVQFVNLEFTEQGRRNVTRFPRFHGNVENATDWLAEVFEWLSGAHDLAVGERDSVGRVPFHAGVHGKFGLDPIVPYAALAMRALNGEIRRVLGDRWPERPATPWPHVPGCVVAATHDVDYLPTSRAVKLRRVIKDGVIAAVIEREPARAISVFGLAPSAIHADTSEGIAPVLSREQQHSIRSTFNFICRNLHRRDGGYDITSPAVQGVMKLIAAQGCEIGVHGSYTSLYSEGRLADEYRLAREMGYAVAGGRQHWLRYTQPALLDELQKAGAVYDTSFGYSCRPGYRNGACFPFPPYDFSSESAYSVLELPLAIMDVSLQGERDSAEALGRCRSILAAARSFGWGGISIIWHDTTFSRSPKLGNVYWDLKEQCDSWVPAVEVARTAWSRYEQAGLLPSWRLREITPAVQYETAVQ